MQHQNETPMHIVDEEASAFLPDATSATEDSHTMSSLVNALLRETLDHRPISGPLGSGKSSMLNQIQRAHDEQTFRTVSPEKIHETMSLVGGTEAVSEQTDSTKQATNREHDMQQNHSNHSPIAGPVDSGKSRMLDHYLHRARVHPPVQIVSLNADEVHEVLSKWEGPEQ